MQRFICAMLLAVLSPALGLAQAEPPSAPTPQQAPSAPAPTTPAEPQFPPVNEANFDATSPSKADVEAFLKSSWGYDENRVWEVYSIQKTSAPDVSKVTILVAEKNAPQQQIANLTVFVTPDGKHLIAQDAVLDFGAKPFENNYRLLQQRADGPSRGATAKQFELVEFGDFECPHCKEAQSTAEKLTHDFPQAHFVFENYPLVNIHPAAYKAAAWGTCVAQQGGAAAFFKYADSVFAAQNDLAGQGADQALRNGATAAGADPAKIATCADSPEGKNPVDASLRLGHDLNVNETPMLFIDGRAVPMLAVPYDQLRKIVEYQFALDK